MNYTLTLLERRAQVIVNEMDGQAMITSMPDKDGYVKILIRIRHSADLLFLYHAGTKCGQVMYDECDKQYGW